MWVVVVLVVVLARGLGWAGRGCGCGDDDAKGESGEEAIASCCPLAILFGASTDDSAARLPCTPSVPVYHDRPVVRHPRSNTDRRHPLNHSCSAQAVGRLEKRTVSTALGRAQICSRNL